MIETKNKTKNITQSFASALLRNDITSIERLISEKGSFDIQNDCLESVKVNKREYLFWLKTKLETSIISSIDFDQCLHCKIGNTVIIVNKGEFPREVKDNSERSKTGLMIDIEDGLISAVKFCYVFAKTENKYMFEVKYKP